MHFLVAVMLLVSVVPFTVASQQLPLSERGSASRYFEFDHEIRRVAVIGAGQTDLSAAAALIDSRREVRLFERKDQPGGMWYYREETTAAIPFPYFFLFFSQRLILFFETGA